MQGMNEMIDRVAAAIHPLMVLGTDCEDVPWEMALRRPRYTHLVQQARQNARYAIEALREPTVGMVDSGVAFALCVTISGTYRWSDYVADKHRAMIDAALTASQEPAK